MLSAACEGDQLERSCFHPPTLSGVVEVLCGADHAGDLRTRKSRSGMAVVRVPHLIKHGSAGAEHHGKAGKRGAEALGSALYRYSAHAPGIKAMLNDWHHHVKCEIHVRCHSSAVGGISARHGLKRTRHGDVRFLWLQQALQEDT